MTIDTVQPPEWPTPNAEIEAAIGRFIIAWNVLEREIDRAIADLYDLDYDLTWSVTANLGTKSKLDIFQSGFHVLSEYFQEFDSAAVDKLINDTIDASGEIRNVIIHGQPHPLLVKGETWDIWIKLRALALRVLVTESCTGCCAISNSCAVGISLSMSPDVDDVTAYSTPCLNAQSLNHQSSSVVAG